MSIALNELRVQNSIASGEKLIVAGATAEVQIDYDVLARAIVEQPPQASTKTGPGSSSRSTFLINSEPGVSRSNSPSK